MPGAIASRSLATTAYGFSPSERKCSTATARTHKGWVKSMTPVTSGWVRIASGSRMSPWTTVGRAEPLQQSTGVHDHERVVVDVDHPVVRVDALHHAVRVLHRGQPGAQVQELVDPFSGHHARGSVQARPIGAGAGRGHWYQVHDLLAQLAVGREVVLAAEPPVVYSRRVRSRGVDASRGFALSHDERPFSVFSAQSCPSISSRYRARTCLTASVTGGPTRAGYSACLGEALGNRTSQGRGARPKLARVQAGQRLGELVGEPGAKHRHGPAQRGAAAGHRPVAGGRYRPAPGPSGGRTERPQAWYLRSGRAWAA